MFNDMEMQGNMKLTEEQLASLSSQKAVNEFLETQRESITNIIKQNLAVGDIFKRENLEVFYILNTLVSEKGTKQQLVTKHCQILECSSQQMN